MRRLFILSLLLVLAAPSLAQSKDPCSVVLKRDAVLSRAEHLCWYGAQRFSVLPFVSSAVTSAISHARNEPRGWGSDSEGYARRYGSSLAADAVGDTTQLLVGIALKQDPRYITLGQGTFGSRIAHAIGYTFIQRGASGGRQPAIARFAGVAAMGFVPNAWYPPGSRTAQDGAVRMGIALAGYMCGSMLAEFQPFHHIFHRNK